MGRRITQGLVVLVGLVGGGLFAMSCGSGAEVDIGDPNSTTTSLLECTADDRSKCAGPPDKRCGVATCKEGVCGLEITPGPLTSQRAGDCKRSICTFDGNVIEEYDPSDFYDDGAECTFDMCIDGAPETVILLKQVCPETGEGICSEGVCVECISSGDCFSMNMCILNRCMPKTCASNVVDGEETDVDCGGGCLQCKPGQTCLANSDCRSNVCVGNKCQAPSCEDNEQNDGETDTDCGSACKDPAKLCGDGQGCQLAADCQSNVCWAGKCLAPTCSDGVQNAQETGIDCGGSTCPEC